MQLVDKNSLIGFRRPTQNECVGVHRYAIRRLKSQKRVFGFWSVFLGIVALSLLMAAAGMTGEYDLGQRMILGVLALFAGTLIIWFHQQNRMERYMADKIEQGQFDVLDCKIYEVNEQVRVAHGTVVRICNAQGQHCAEEFRLQFVYVDDWRKNPNLPCRLVRCRNEKSRDKDYYELFTEEKLRRG